MDAVAVASERWVRRPLSGQGRSMALNLAVSPAAAPGIGSLNRVMEQGGALVVCSADGQELLVQRRRFVMFECRCLNINQKITDYCFDLMFLQ